MIPRRFFPTQYWIEPILALLIAAAVGYDIWFFTQNDYLPQPFFYEPYDVWMDWFNTSSWAHSKEAYGLHSTIYPPASFVFLRMFGVPRCYIDLDPNMARECDWIGLYALHGIFLLNLILCGLTFRKLDRRTWIPRTFGLGFGLPMLHALERGNLVLPSLTFVILGFGPLLKSARARWFWVGVALNFKIYLIAAMIPYLVRRRWRWFENAMLSAVLVYLVTYTIQGLGSPIEIYDNIRGYAAAYGQSSSSLLDGWAASTYTAFIALMNGTEIPATQFIGSRNVELLLIFLPAFQHTAQAAILFAMVAALVRPEAVQMFRLVNLGLLLAVITSEAGSYTSIMFIYFVFMERWRGIGPRIALVTAYICCIPYDLAIGYVPPMVRDTYFGHHTTIIEYGVTIGPFLRPGLYLLIAIALSCTTIWQVWLDIQAQGWKSRWRFRRDTPIMVGEGTARPPA